MTDSENGWVQTLAELAVRRRTAKSLGGPTRVARQHADGKLDARARLAALLDPGSFREIGTLVGELPADGVVTGWGTIEGRSVLVAAEDFTTAAGSIGHGSHAKRIRIAELALQESVPLVMLLDGAGFRPEEGGGAGRSPTDLTLQARCSGEVPLVTGILGPSAGHGALVAPMSDFTVMTGRGAIFTAGPPVVRESTGEEVDKTNLGGPDVAINSGLVHNLAADDYAALAQIRYYLSHFPSSAWSHPPIGQAIESKASPEDLLDIIPRESRRGYDMRLVIDALVDGGEWLEVQSGFGKSIIAGLSRFDGRPVAIVANQPQVLAGAIDVDAADKAAHFISVADSFHLPILFLSDNPGMLPGSASERRAILRSGARMFAAQTQATSPKINITFRKAYGFGSMVMAMTSFEGQTGVFGFPGATLGAMSAAAMSRATGAGEDRRRALGDLETHASYLAAGRLGFDELIDPRDTRSVIVDTLRHAANRQQRPPAPKLRKAITP